MSKTSPLSFPSKKASPDYVGLVSFLVQPLLDSPTSVIVDCEQYNNAEKVWIRLAFEASDKGRVFGRGGRNIQAIRTLLETAGAAVGQSVYLDVYGGGGGQSQSYPSRDNPLTGDRELKKRRPTTNGETPTPRPQGRNPLS